MEKTEEAAAVQHQLEAQELCSDSVQHYTEMKQTLDKCVEEMQNMHADLLMRRVMVFKRKVDALALVKRLEMARAFIQKFIEEQQPESSGEVTATDHN